MPRAHTPSNKLVTAGTAARWRTARGIVTAARHSPRPSKVAFATVSLPRWVIADYLVLSVGTLFNSILVASPQATFAKMANMLASGELLQHVGVSLGECWSAMSWAARLVLCSEP